mgnify:CR=1 FL=1
MSANRSRTGGASIGGRFTRVAVVAGGLALLCVAGCETPPAATEPASTPGARRSDEAGRPPAWASAGTRLRSTSTGGSSRQSDSASALDDSDVVAVYTYYDSDPWLRDVDGHVVGFKVRAYIASGRTDKGIFVPGDIEVTASLLRPRRGGGFLREPVHEWRFSEAEARGFRVRKPSILGESYGLVLRWPPDLDLSGRRVEIQISYQRSDGVVIKGPPRALSVPLPAGYEVAPGAAGPPPADARRQSEAAPRGARPVSPTRPSLQPEPQPAEPP